MKKQSGFSLLEVLISVVVLCFGVLGAVGLQLTSLQANRESRLQATAVRLGEEIAELMRANKNVAIKTVAADNPYLTSTVNVTANPACGYAASSASCSTSAAVAQRDMYEWAQRVSKELPGAKVVICQDATPYDSNGLPQWTCSDTGGVIVLKMGWTRTNTLRGATGADATNTSAANTGAFDKALRPAIVLSLNPGSSE